MKRKLFVVAFIACSAFPAAAQDKLCAAMKEVVAKLAAKDLSTLRGAYQHDGVANKIYTALTQLPGFSECEFVESGTTAASDRSLSCSLTERSDSAATARAKTLQEIVRQCFPEAKSGSFSQDLYINRLPDGIDISISATVGSAIFFDISRVW
jgi:hypothetical protein